MDAGSFLVLGALMALMFFMIIRPQQKRQKEVRELQSSLAKGDDVITIGGLHGRVFAIADDFIDLEVTDDIILRFQRNAISKKVPHVVPNEAAEA